MVSAIYSKESLPLRLSGSGASEKGTSKMNSQRLKLCMGGINEFDERAELELYLIELLI